MTNARDTFAPSGAGPLAASEQSAAAVRQGRVPAAFVDAEDGPPRLGLAAELATVRGVRHPTLREMEAGALRRVTKAAPDRGWTQPAP